MTDAVIAAIPRKYNIGWWSVSLRVYGREQITNAEFAILEAAVQSIKPMAIKPFLWRQGDPIPSSQQGLMGVPMTVPMQMANGMEDEAGTSFFGSDATFGPACSFPFLEPLHMLSGSQYRPTNRIHRR